MGTGSQLSQRAWFGKRVLLSSEEKNLKKNQPPHIMHEKLISHKQGLEAEQSSLLGREDEVQ